MFLELNFWTKGMRTEMDQNMVSRKTKPTYLRMIAKALLSLSESENKLYHSRYVIAKFIQSVYPVPESFKRYLRANLKEGVQWNYFLQKKDSFRLSRVGKEALLSKEAKGSKKKTKVSKKKKAKIPKKKARAPGSSQTSKRKAARNL